MTGWLHAGAAAAWAAAALAYFHGRFRLAGLCGLCFWGLEAAVVLEAASPWTAALLLGLLALVPAVFLLLHVIDAKKGIFLLPTVYSIPFAFFCGLLLWVAAALVLLRSGAP